MAATVKILISFNGPLVLVFATYKSKTQSLTKILIDRP